MIKKEEKITLSPWVTVLERTINLGTEDEVYHSLLQNDYVSIVAVTIDNQLLLVEQYRPALDKFTIELPSGLLEENETSESCARRELLEETGYEVKSELVSLGSYSPDTGRLCNRIHGYFSTNVTVKELSNSEPNIRAFSIPLNEIMTYIQNGKIENALHVMYIYIALYKNYMVID